MRYKLANYVLATAQSEARHCNLALDTQSKDAIILVRADTVSAKYYFLIGLVCLVYSNSFGWCLAHRGTS
jgi:hypothetical protein